MSDVREGAVEGDPVADINVEAVLPVCLVDPVSISQGKRLALFTITCVKHTHISLSRHMQELRQSIPPHCISSAGTHIVQRSKVSCFHVDKITGIVF